MHNELLLGHRKASNSFYRQPRMAWNSALLQSLCKWSKTRSKSFTRNWTSFSTSQGNQPFKTFKWVRKPPNWARYWISKPFELFVSFQSGLTSIEHDNFEESYLKFKSVEANATRGFNLSMSDENRLVCTRLKIFAQVMVLTFDHKSRTFVPFEIVPPKKKREVGAAVQASIDFLHENLSGVEFSFTDHFLPRTKEKKLQSHRDSVDKVKIRVCSVIEDTMMMTM